MAKYWKTAASVIGFSVLAVALLVIVIIPVLKGYTSYVIVSESMEPALSRGDMIEVEQVAASQLAPGDIITVRSGDGAETFTHRILYMDNANGLIYTKGDANATQDLYPVAYERVLGRVVYKIPYVGKAVLLFRKGD